MINQRIKDLCSEDGIGRSLEKIKFHIRQNKYIEREKIGNGGSLPFAHVTYCTAANAGDTVLSQCVRKTITTEMKTSSWQMIPVKNKVTVDTINKINECGMLVIGGGGLFLPDTNENAISGWQWAVSKNQLSDIQVPICVYSVGYNYFRGQEANELFIDSLNDLVTKSSFFGLRNMGSIKAISDFLPPKILSKVTYQPCTTTLIRKLYGESIPKKKETRSIAINMAFDRESLRFGDKKDAILIQVADAIKKIENQDYKIFYVCHCWEDDKFLPYLRSLKVNYKLIDLSRKFPEEVYNFYNNMDLVLGMRGHAQMIPFGLNCEIISLGTHDKMRWFLEDIDATDWYIDLTSDVDNLSESIYNRFCYIHEKNREETIQRLLKAQEKLWKITVNNLKAIETTQKQQPSIY